MMKVQNKKLSGRTIQTPKGVITLDAAGFSEVSEEIAAYLKGVDGFTVGGGQAQKAQEAPKGQVKDPDFAGMNVPQLKKWAKDNGIDTGDAKTKQEVLSAIENAGK